MIITLKQKTKTKFFKEVIEYFDRWGIPADMTGRTENQLIRSGSNPGYKGDIKDDKMLVFAKEGYEILLLKLSARYSEFQFELHLENGRRYECDAIFINEEQIKVKKIRPYPNL